MKITVSNNGGVERFQRRLERIARGEHRLPIAQAAAGEVRELIAEEFAQGQDFTGWPWASKADGERSFLTESHELAGAFEITAEEDGVSIANPTPYAGCHQGGTSRMPARKMLPEDELPPEWEERIGNAGHEVFHEMLEDKE